MFASFDRLWCDEPDATNKAIGYAKFHSRSRDAVMRAFDEAGNVNRNARTRWRIQRDVARVMFARALEFVAGLRFVVRFVFTGCSQRFEARVAHFELGAHFLNANARGSL